ncbi:hypothetical protein ACLBOM_37225 [Escherichia coli]
MLHKHLPLKEMAALYIEGKQNGWHQEGINALENYLSTLAGFPDRASGKPFRANGIRASLTSTASLSSSSPKCWPCLTTYGHIFANDAGDIDLRDVLHNDRALVVLIPALELSDQKSARLGKLYISAKRMVIAPRPRLHLEGKREQVLTAKKTRTLPFPDIHDELGSYFAPGMDSLPPRCAASATC